MEDLRIEKDGMEIEVVNGVVSVDGEVVGCIRSGEVEFGFSEEGDDSEYDVNEIVEVVVDFISEQ